MKKNSFLIALLFITFVCFPQEILISHSGNINRDTRLSELIPFSITELCFLRVRVEAQGFSPVFDFYPEEGRGFQWDGEQDGILIYSDIFELPMNYDVQIYASDWEGILGTEFNITITKITPEKITLGGSVTGNYFSDGEKESYDYVVWYTLEITEPGNYSAFLTGDTDTQLTINRELYFYKSLRIYDDQIANNISFVISEPGLYGIRISFYGREKGEYIFTITKN